MAPVYLIRHTAVAKHWAGRCYGQSDVGLSREGRETARALAPQLAAFQVPRIHVSPLRRARYLGGLVSRASGAELLIEPRLAECHFGAWEAQAWDAIYAASGDAMMGLVAAPDTFRPGGHGETTYAMRDRVMDWFNEALRNREGPVLAICHGGPIAAIRGSLGGVPVSAWPTLVPRYGEIVTINV